MKWTDGMEHLVDEAVLAVWMSGDVCVNWNEPKVCHAYYYGPAFG